MMSTTNPFPQLTSTTNVIFPPSNSFLDHEKCDLYTNPFLSGDCFGEGLGLEQCDEYNHLFLSELKNKKTSKKDHHSKIHTARGPRDRRVRLSIEHDYNDKIGESTMEDNISMLYSYQHNLAVSNDSSPKFTCLPKFTDFDEQSDDCAAI
ncbi:hypothetical protein L1987_44094 [Smallanthus sonchifolius]|uniref:Uncharacterized protein n=1 Tax=Smallanthus sonchifolius TaxID=185202 RepID=A0ACB9GP61_9ASTR|nr:hypothetical protein L1987_44094 [Smallanthus sonchifolius]